jgi:lipoate-protein ligase A
MLIVQSESTDVYRNLAVEEWLLDNVSGQSVLFLCVNDPCVVIGKNQNPWRECRLSLMEAEGVPLARRISGGGAVYHDPGNLNVSVMVDRTQYVEKKQYDFIFQTLGAFGIRGAIFGKNSLAVNDLKFSGQAFCHRRGRTLHHGTILVDADLARLGRYLGPELEGIETKAVASVPAKVANLTQFAPDLTVESLAASLSGQCIEMYGEEEFQVPSSELSCVDIPEQQLLPMIGKNSSNDWNLCHTPKFVFHSPSPEGSGVTERVEVVKGRVGDVLFSEWLMKG